MAIVNASGEVVRVSGPLVEVRGLGDVAMSDVVELGESALTGEVVAVSREVATVQAYEYTGGLAPGAKARGRGELLSAELGPGLLGGVFDGLLRPLSGGPVWLTPDADRSRAERRWEFVPVEGRSPEVASGDLLGTVPNAGSVEHRVLVPSDVQGQLEWLAPAGEYLPDEPVARVDGQAIALRSRWPVRRPKPVSRRLDAVTPLLTGQRVIDILFPVLLGSTAAVPGGFGTGKTLLLQQIAKWCAADVIVYVGCGERGNEMADVIEEFAGLPDPRTGGRLADRTVIIANTSNMPMMARELSIYAGVTVAEYFRDMGYHAVVIADSTSRWAEALREFASRRGQLPAEEGFPAGLASALAAFYERAGAAHTLGGREGSVTIIGAVSPPGGDFTEPVTAQTQRFIRTQWVLDRDLAYSRHYPAVAWAGSFSRDTAAAAAEFIRLGDRSWPARRARVAAVLAEADRLTALAELVGVSALPGRERVVILGGRLLREGLLQQNALNDNDASCTPQKAAAIADGVLAVLDSSQRLIELGIPAATIEQQDFSPLLRAREDLRGDDLAGLAERVRALLAELANLEPVS